MSGALTMVFAVAILGFLAYAALKIGFEIGKVMIIGVVLLVAMGALLSLT